MTSAPAPPAAITYKRKLSISAALRELWQRRELIMTLAERDLRVRYKQTRLGFAWSIIMPLLLMTVFTVFLRRVVSIDTGGAPYPIFVLLGLIPWTMFSVSVNHGGQSLINSAGLLNKVYCPREVFPLSSIVVSGFDAVISTIILVFFFVFSGYVPKVEILWVPVLLVIQLVFTVAVTLVTSAFAVYVRDLRQALPLLLQLALFATPVAYPIPFSPTFEKAYAVINPLAPLIEGYRLTMLFGEPPKWDMVALSAATSVLLLVSGYRLFKRLETGFADVA